MPTLHISPNAGIGSCVINSAFEHRAQVGGLPWHKYSPERGRYPSGRQNTRQQPEILNQTGVGSKMHFYFNDP